MKNKILDIIQASLVADTYSLGSHWIYSVEELKNNNLDWKNLNAPLAAWHGTKQKGDFTHYGDQLVCLYEYINKNKEFDFVHYIKIWKEYMEKYTGYKDGSTTDTIKNLNENQNIPCGAISHDLSIIGRITPLLLVSKDEKAFLNNVNNFVSLTHDSEEVLESAEFFAKVLWAVIIGYPIVKSIKDISERYSQRLQDYVTSGLTNSNNTLEAIHEFGPACSINGGFQGIVYILNKYGNNYEKALTQNAKAGGDSSARAMIISMLLIASNGLEIVPKNWITQMNYKM
jgi:ADP-ribosylglycohydrolase